MLRMWGGAGVFRFPVLWSTFLFSKLQTHSEQQFLDSSKFFLSAEQWHQFSKCLLGAWQMAVASAHLDPTYQSGGFPSELSASQLSSLRVQYSLTRI